MSGKSRHGKGKGQQSSKKKKNIRRSQQAVASPPQPQTARPVAEAPAVAPTPEVPVAAAIKAEPATLAATASYPNLPFELRRIGILAAVMLAVLVVLALILG